MLNRLRQWMTRANAPERPIVVNRDGSFTVNDKALDAAADAASHRRHWPEGIEYPSRQRHDDAKVWRVEISAPGKNR